MITENDKQYLKRSVELAQEALELEIPRLDHCWYRAKEKYCLKTTIEMLMETTQNTLNMPLQNGR